MKRIVESSLSEKVEGIGLLCVSALPALDEVVFRKACKEIIEGLENPSYEVIALLGWLKCCRFLDKDHCQVEISPVTLISDDFRLTEDQIASLVSLGLLPDSPSVDRMRMALNPYEE